MSKVGIGMRSIKTGLAVFICLALYSVIPLTEPTLAVLVAVISIQNSIEDSVTFSKNRLLGTILGTIIGILYTQIAGQSLVFVGIGVIVLITLLNKLNQSQNIVIAMVLFVNIITGVVKGNPIIYALSRFANTLIGITVGFLINYFIKPPNQIENIKQHVIVAVDEIENVVKDLIFTDREIDLKSFKRDIRDIEKSLKIYNQDRKYRIPEMDKIKYVEDSVINYNKLYSHMYIVKDKRDVLCDENIKKVNLIFDMEYKLQDNIKPDDEYNIIYNYHIREIIEMITIIRKDLASVSSGKAIETGYKKKIRAYLKKIKNYRGK